MASCNPRFPAETFVARFVKRRTDHQQQCQSSSGQSSQTKQNELCCIAKCLIVQFQFWLIFSHIFLTSFFARYYNISSSSSQLDYNDPLFCVFPLEAETQNRPPSSTQPVQPVGGKRKRTDGEAEAAAKVAKKQRADTDEEKIPPAESRPTKRRGRTRRSQGSKEQKEPADKGPPAPPEDGAVIVLLDEDNEKKGLKKL